MEEIDNFLKETGMWISFKDLNVTKKEIKDIANDDQVLNDYKNNPRIASIDEMCNMLIKCYEK